MATITDTHLSRALLVTPNASQTRSKAPGNVGPRDTSQDFPLFASRGEGAYLFDDRGRKYLDCFGANAAVPLGHAFPAVVEAVTQAVREGNLLSLPSVLEASVAERFLEVCAPWAHQVRWVKTGSEATHAALMIARAATGRWRYVRLRESYHGWHFEWLLDARDVNWFDAGYELPKVADGELAAVFIEAPRWKAIDPRWLRHIADESRACGAVIVFDEMVYGLRWAKGGAAEYYGVTPDLACFGKALGNGVPVACVCGPSHLMQHAGLVSGTYGGDMLGLAAADAVLRTYQERDVIGELRMIGLALRDEFGRHAPHEARLEGTPQHWRLVMPDDEALDRVLMASACEGVLVHRAANSIMAAMTLGEARHACEVIGRAAAEILR